MIEIITLFRFGFEPFRATLSRFFDLRAFTGSTYRFQVKFLNLKRVLKSVLVISPIVTVQNQFIDSTFDWSLSQKLRRQIFSIFPKRNQISPLKILTIMEMNIFISQFHQSHSRNCPIISKAIQIINLKGKSGRFYT